MTMWQVLIVGPERICALLNLPFRQTCEIPSWPLALSYIRSMSCFARSTSPSLGVPPRNSEYRIDIQRFPVPNTLHTTKVEVRQILGAQTALPKPGDDIVVVVASRITPVDSWVRYRTQ